MNAEQVSPSRLHQSPLSPDASLSPKNKPNPQSVSNPRPRSSQTSSESKRYSLPFAFPPLFSHPANSSSTSLVPAEGRPIPLDDSTAAHRISTLRELNSHNPSPVNRHRYTKSTGAQSSTYSQPVIVRTYSGPSPSNTHSYPYRPSSVSRGGSKRIPLPPSSQTGSYLSRGSVKPTISQTGGPRPGPPSSTGSANGRVIVPNMPRHKPKKSKVPWQWPLISQRDTEEPKLPPLEAFSFRSFMADLQNEGVISQDIDRIAEICARSKYSMSNQYEVHVAPHGSGSSFATSSARNRTRGPVSSLGGPTLQAIASDDESSARGHRKRRSGGRQKSVAYGTLETIMSSSGSSEDGKGKKKSAAEIAEEVRGRAARKSSESAEVSGVTAGSGSGTQSGNAFGETSGQHHDPARRRATRRKSASLANALLENRKHSTRTDDVTSPRSSAAALVSEPAQPQTSPSHLEIRTAPDSALADQPPQNVELMDELADMVSRTDAQNLQNSGSISGWNAWIPWKGASASSQTGQSSQGNGTSSHAEGSLRQLLMTLESKDSDKGKAVVRDG